MRKANPNYPASMMGVSSGIGPVEQQRDESGKQVAGFLPSLTLPKGGGAIRGIGEKFAANPVTGTGSMTVPIATSPGRSGFGPQLSLSYDSGAGNGPFGFGWNLSLPSITRKTDKGLPRYDDANDSDVFILSGAEDLVPVLIKNEDEQWGPEKVPDQTVNGRTYEIRRYRPRIEGLFARIERWTNKIDRTDTFWRSISRDNIMTWYGKTKDSRITDPDDDSRIFTWLICESYDDKGNIVAYRYKEEDGAGVDLTKANERNRGDRDSPQRKVNRYLKRIRYGNRSPYLPTLKDDSPWPAPPGDGEWLFEVVFDYGEHNDKDPKPDDNGAWCVRNDSFSSYRAGYEIRTYRLCQRVLMFHHFFGELGTNDCLVRSTEFKYEESPIASFITAITQSGYVRSGDGKFLKKALPPVEFEYSKAELDEKVRQVKAENLENLPIGLDGSTYQWVDLDGEGISGFLTEQGGAWFYKRNLSPANVVADNGRKHTEPRFGPAELVASRPILTLAAGQSQFMDLASDGQVDLVTFEGPAPGFYERTDDAGWSSFHPFASWPDIDTRDPNLKFIDLDGDGHADILISEDEAFSWYPSLAEKGFGPSELVHQPNDEEKGPRLVFADGTQSIYLADLSGDGLTDLVRIRNGEVCYWPNLGYGRFGAKVTMDNSPWFDSPDQFDQKRIRLADIDGSGTTDIIYLGADAVRIYRNQCGNRWASPENLKSFPPVDNLSSVAAVDLLGNGTACLVWSSSLPADANIPMKYIDLMGGQKPHLLISVRNNLGAETLIDYASSTKFYIEDKAKGKPWITRLPFPVHVVERVETYDYVSRNRFVTRYAYHHGYFDGEEHEFRGFGMVEQLDTEEFAALSDRETFPEAANIDGTSYVPPVLTRTWFHTGAYVESGRISKQFEHEYYREGDPSLGEGELTDEQLQGILLPDTVLPANMTAEDGREACRALKGSVLRRETFALDRRPDGTLTEESDRPYSVSERNYTIKRLQPRGQNRHAVFFTHPRETADFHYERKLVDVNGKKLADPRVTHSLTLKVDDYGNVERTVVIGYRRRDMPDVNNPEHKDTHFTFTVSRFINKADEQDWFRVGLPVETRTFEIVKPPEPRVCDGIVKLFSFDDVDTLTQGLFPLTSTQPDETNTWPYEKWDWRRNPANAPSETKLRLVEHVRTLYRRNDLSGPKGFKEVDSLALPYETYKLAFTTGLLDEVFIKSGKTTAAELNDILQNEGKYVHFEGDANWWIPSGRVFYSPATSDDAAAEFAYACRHFFLPHRYRDPFHTDIVGTETLVAYDGYDLLIASTEDAVHNKVTAENNYRVLQPRLITEPNGNRTEVAYDALGMVAGTAVMGKAGQTAGDTLSGFEADLTAAQTEDFYQADDPHLSAVTLLKSATTRIIYDLERFLRTQQASPNEPSKWQPAYAATLARETHVSDSPPPGGLKIHIGFSYSDGFGREIQKKVQAEPGPVFEGGPVVNQRWAGTGWTIFNNKGKAVRQYEPFFSRLPERRHHFEFAAQFGFSPILFYDPMERVVATLHPNQTYEKVVFDPWQQRTYDVNDTVSANDTETGDPRTDEDIKGFVAEYFKNQSNWETWYKQRITGAKGAEEKNAAEKTDRHANTPTVAHFDSLGRTFLTVAHNRFTHRTNGAVEIKEEKYPTRVIFDIEGNQREVIDAKGRVVMRYDYDMLSNRVHQASMEAGERWTLNDVTAKPIRTWDSRGFIRQMTYDKLRRPTGLYVTENGAKRLAERTIYGESQGNANNHRTRVYQAFDGAGVVTNDAYDFKGNLLRSTRQLAAVYGAPINWATVIPMDSETYPSTTTYDALNRPTTLRTPDNSVIRHTYNEANLLERVDVNLRGAQANGQPVWTPFITNIDYNAKGQRILIDYGNGVRTTYEYDQLTFRLIHLLTRRDAVVFPDDCPQPPPSGWPGCQVQNLRYTYDPAGNITYIRDDAQQTIFFRNKRVEPSNDYIYDAIYRLIEASGREHLGQAGGTPIPHSYNDAPRAGIDWSRNDGNAMGRYLEEYIYDEAGNFAKMIHHGSDPQNAGWSRSYTYNETSQLEPGRKSNRLSSTTVGNGTPETYAYDQHGNMLQMPHLPAMEWDFKDQLQVTQRQIVNNAPGERTYYIYDSTGQRVRKVTDRADGTRKNERIYLGGFEIYREYESDGVTRKLERETLHVMDDKQRIALVETKTIDTDDNTDLNVPLIRYQFGNHLGSACLELDHNAIEITYEEYYPYGSTSYQAVNPAIKAAAKRYRYTGKEKDEESGFYYHGARYYAPWLGRWTAVDPTGLNDGTNLYIYSLCAPSTHIDPTGQQNCPIYETIVCSRPGGCKEARADLERKIAACSEEKTKASLSQTQSSSSTQDIPPTSPPNTSLYIPQGYLWTQYTTAFRETFAPNTPWWGRLGLGILAIGTAIPAGIEEYVARPLSNIPFTVHNSGIGIGEHSARAYLLSKQGESGEAIAEGLSVVQNASTGFVAAASVAAPLAGGTGARAASARPSIPPPAPTIVSPGAIGRASGITYPGLTLQPYEGLLGRLRLSRPTFNPSIDIVSNPVGSTLAGVGRHEAVHAFDMLNFPQFSYMGTTSLLPGRGIAAFLMETRGYFAEFGVQGLLPNYAWRSMTNLERAYFTGELTLVGYGTYRLTRPSE